ncbi:phosphoribosylamine--glycine ligase [Cellulomonas terrae]|uniref:phosphoribosylamine--glycine ligase n=1 Tax=Cellulomonas terrae TaxID=311234 RepID=A0A511JK30_9CELL|nr:phosphoribosylglycinamide synthetase C domain-containing protein [Cellulomonas terrae]GEL98361.1 phosphoribosylamine--glycine ligase [Cellulomonas terrae]
MSGPRVLVVGTGARKHALVRRLVAEGCSEVWTAPSNPALDSTGALPAPAPVEPPRRLTDWAADRRIELAVVLDESLLFQGLADALLHVGVPCVGPTRAAAVLEQSKTFGKDVMTAAEVPTPPWRAFPSALAALADCASWSYPAVVKVDGPPLGTGVRIVDDAQGARSALRDILAREVATAAVLVEEFVPGPEYSFSVLTDGRGGLVLLPVIHEYNRVARDSRSALTRGMGAVAPAPVDDRVADIVFGALGRMLLEMAELGRPYVGSATTNVVVGPDGPVLLEVNSHFGDPETQTVLPLLDVTLVDLLLATAHGSLAGTTDLRTSPLASVTTTVARDGYPGGPRHDVVLPSALLSDADLLFYETRRTGHGLTPSGGRVVSCNATAPDLETAAAQARATAALVAASLGGVTFRDDIGTTTADLAVSAPTSRQESP